MGFFDDLKDVPLIGPIVEGVGNLFGASEDRDHQGEMQRRNADLQREFATHGVRWRVEDAKAAGIHPLAALGAQTHSATPHHVGDTSPMGDFSRNMGQSLSRAIQAGRTSDEQQLAKLQLAAAKADVEGKELDNQIKNSELQKLNSVPTSFPGSQSFLPGQGNSPTQGIVNKPLERVTGKNGVEMGAILDTGWASTHDGSVVPIPSKDVKERIEDNLIQETMHAIRNNLLPNFGSGPKPPIEALPPGYDRWMWHHGKQAYVPVKKSGGWRFSPATGFGVYPE